VSRRAVAFLVLDPPHPETSRGDDTRRPNNSWRYGSVRFLEGVGIALPRHCEQRSFIHHICAQGYHHSSGLRGVLTAPEIDRRAGADSTHQTAA